jgi:hypothetical protein
MKEKVKPKIICCHIPLVPLREERVLAKSFGFESYAARDRELLDLIEQHADTIIAVLSGHLHLTGMVERKSIFHVCLSGTGQYPGDYAAVYEVYPDRIQSMMVQLPPHLVRPAGIPDRYVGSIHGKPFREVDHIDDRHPTPGTYLGGLPGERRFVITLPPTKRPAWRQ